jgi:hypothetical protein
MTLLPKEDDWFGWLKHMAQQHGYKSQMMPQKFVEQLYAEVSTLRQQSNIIKEEEHMGIKDAVRDLMEMHTMNTNPFEGSNIPPVNYEITLPSTGKTLRDEFAIAALIGLLAHQDEWGSCEEFAAQSYKISDAMLKERENKS